MSAHNLKKRTRSRTAKSSRSTNEVNDKLAAAPFNRPTADITFSTCDGVVYLLHKSILSIASPFFEDMFSLTQPRDTDTASPDLETITITEDSQTFDTLLRHLYPVDRPRFLTLASLIPVLEAAIKYQISSTVSVLRETIIRFLETDTLDVYATACRLDLEDEARLAAVKWKSLSSWDDASPDFSETSAGTSYKPEGQISRISAGSFFNLLRFMRTDTVSNMRFTANPASSASPNLPCVPEDQSSCDVVFIANNSARIPAHSFLIRLVYGEALFDDRIPCTGSSSLSEFNINLDATTLQALVMMCYPHQDIHSIPIDVFQDTIAAAIRFKASNTTVFLRAQLRKRINTNAVAVYRVAISQGWKDEAQEALQALLQAGVPNDSFSSDFNGASALEYWQILELAHQYELAALKLIQPQNRFCSEQWKCIDGGLSQFLSTTPSLASNAPGSLEYCFSCRNYPSRRSSCRCIVNTLHQYREDCKSIQADLKAAAAQIASEFLSKIMP